MTTGNLGSTRVFGHARGGVVEVGMRRRPGKDLYHWLVTGPWRRLLMVYGVVYFATEAVFAAADLVIGQVPASRAEFTAALTEAIRAPVEGGDATVPLRTVVAGLVGSVEGFVRWLEVAMGASLFLTKFAVLKPRVMFSRSVVVAPDGGELALMFRMANERTSNIIDAKVNALVLLNETDARGEVVRRAHDLPLARGGSAVFTHAWTAIHPVDADSPLRGMGETELQLAEAEVIVTLSGFDEALSRIMTVRHVYPTERILWNHRFREIVKTLPDGRRRIDYRRFHETDPVLEEKSPRARRRG